MKHIVVSDELHARLKDRADRERRKLYGLVEHLVELGEEYEKNLKNTYVAPNKQKTEEK